MHFSPFLTIQKKVLSMQLTLKNGTQSEEWAMLISVCVHRWMIGWMKTSNNTIWKRNTNRKEGKCFNVDAIPDAEADVDGKKKVTSQTYEKDWQVLLFCQSEEFWKKYHQNDWHWIIAQFFTLLVRVFHLCAHFICSFFPGRLVTF